jgi:dihydrofolate synthase/folylpolyglutamate synthase
MTYEEVLQKLNALGPELASTPGKPARKFTLDAMRALLDALGNPERKFATVLIAGTNGKGSTAATLAAIASAAGLRTGLYTSPHLQNVNERIRVSAEGDVSAKHELEEIKDEMFAELFTAADEAASSLVLRGVLPNYPSFFELLTAVGFLCFAERGVELAVVEVGLGGRLDATNVVEPLVSVITDIGMDHMDFLGNTMREIAGEKAGILRQDGVLVTLSQHPEANAAIGEVAVAKNVRGVDAARCLPPTRHVAGDWRRADGELLPPNRYDLSIDGERVRIDSPLLGQHQQRNIALAVAAAVELRSNHGFAIDNAAIEAGVRDTVWPGRLELIASRRGHAPLLLDVAHNPAGAWTLRAAIANLQQQKARTLIFSCLADKAIDEMAQVLLPLFDNTSGDPDRARDHVVFAPIQNPRAATVEQLMEAARRLDVPAHAAPHVPGALAQAVAVTPVDGIIVATGSIFLVGELRALALGDFAQDKAVA